MAHTQMWWICSQKQTNFSSLSEHFSVCDASTLGDIFVHFVRAEQGIKFEPVTPVSCIELCTPSAKGWKPVTLLVNVNSNRKKNDDAISFSILFSQSSPSPFFQCVSLHSLRLPSIPLAVPPNVTVAIATQVLRPGSFPASPAVLEGILGYVVLKRLIIQASH